MPFEEVLFQYGVAGAMLAYFAYVQIKCFPPITTAINNNTVAMTKVYEVMNHCKNSNKKYIKVKH